MHTVAPGESATKQVHADQENAPENKKYDNQFQAASVSQGLVSRRKFFATSDRASRVANTPFSVNIYRLDAPPLTCGAGRRDCLS